MSISLLKRILKSPYIPSFDYWRVVVLPRVLLCSLVAIFNMLDASDTHKADIYNLIVAYLVFYFILGFVKSDVALDRRVRLVTAATDVCFVTSVIYHTGGARSPWFLAYLFPILSASTQLSNLGAGAVALLMTTAYYWVYFRVSPSAGHELNTFALRCLLFGGVAVAARHLFRRKHAEEIAALKVSEEINNAIMSNTSGEVFELILKRALEITHSDDGHIRFIGENGGRAEIVASTRTPTWGLETLSQLNRSFSKQVITSQKPLVISSISHAHLRANLGKYFRFHSPRPKSALFMPLMIEEAVVGTLAVYSRRRFNYADIDLPRLGSFAQMIALALKNTELHARLAADATERRGRLKLLHELGERLTARTDLADLFQRVVELVYTQLNVEEAALFIREDESPTRIRKVAVKGPNAEVTSLLSRVELSYQVGESVVGAVFRSRQPMYLNEVSPVVAYVDDYMRVLPSGQVRNYMGVPLVFGAETLGVIRVINKMATKGAAGEKSVELSASGFDEEDMVLLQTIAGQVAIAIQNASLLAKFIEAQRYYQNVVLNSPDPIYVVDTEGRLKTFNKACELLWGVSFEEAVGQPIADYYESRERARQVGKALLSQAEHRIDNYEMMIRNREGTLIPVSLSGSMLFDDKGQAIGSIGILKDLRGPKELEEKMLQSEKLAALGKLVHTVGHDIKHNIATALNYVGMLTLDCDPHEDAELLTIYEDIRSSLWEAVDKLQNMLTATRPRAAQKRAADIEEIFDEIADRLTKRADSLGAKFSIDYPRERREVYLDIAQMQQAVMNLFDNSLSAIDEKRRSGTLNGTPGIEASLKFSDDELHLLWSDDGCGIPTANLPHVFTPFFTTTTTGNGLGLFIVKQVVEKHGGMISVESEEGSGARFLISIPAL